MAPFLRARAALAEAILAAAVVGVVEGCRIAVSGGLGPGAVRAFAGWLVLSGLASLGAIALAIVLVAVYAAISRAPIVAAWTHDVAAGALARTLAVWRAALAATTVATFAVGSFAVAARVHDGYRFHDAGPVGLLTAGALTSGGALLAFAAIEIDRWVSTRLRASAWAATALDGRRVWAAAVLAAAVVAIGPVAAIHAAAPAVSLAAVTSGSLLIAALGLLRAVRAGRSRATRIGAIAVLAACAAATVASRSAEQARAGAVSHGWLSRSVLRALWAVADRDGDGYPGSLAGGSDCDDGDRRRHPRAVEIAGNGIDENCTGAELPPAPRPAVDARAGRTTGAHRNILLISVDALRADHLGAWGYRRPISPAIDALAAQGARFAWAFTPSPTTRRAIPSLFTGRYPSSLHWKKGKLSIDDSAAPPLARVLRDAGWLTAAITCCERFATARRELTGFSSLDASADAVLMTRPGRANADAVADRAITWLRQRAAADRPWLLWLHFYDPHHPYVTPPGERDLGDRELDRYDAEIGFSDRHLARVLATLDEVALASTTIVAFTADHGEEFSEHGLRFHARSLFNPVVRVPLIVRDPGSPPTVIDTPVSLVDVMPTLLELAGVDGPSGMNGHSLAAAVRGDADAPARPVLLELTPDRQIARDLAGVVSGEWKAVWDREANAWTLFSLHDDPGDMVDQSRSQPEQLQALRNALFYAMDRELATPPR